MGNGQGRWGFRGTSNGVIRLLAEICGPLLPREGEAREGLGIARQRWSEMGQREPKRAKLWLAAVSKGLHRGPTCQWGGHPSRL